MIYKTLASCIALVLGFFSVFSQPVLKADIGVGALPNDLDPICATPWYLGKMNASGLQVADTAADFVLYDLNGDSMRLSDDLKNGMPVLLIAGSYTCPAFRHKVPSINNVVSKYGRQLKVYIIYTVEAHPHLDPSVYYGFTNTRSENFTDGILYRARKTYGERKDIAADMLGNMTILAPVFLDGPCNNWWTYYGPAPHNAYLIDTTGIVFAKHGWYDYYPDDIICDVDSLLGYPKTCNKGPTKYGTFDYKLISADTVSGNSGTTITMQAELENNSNDSVVIDIIRRVNDLPNQWESALCADICYPSSVDSVSILLTQGSKMTFYFYFYTSGPADTGRAQVIFTNPEMPGNYFSQNIVGISDTNAITHTGINQHGFNSNVLVYPNPIKDKFYIESPVGGELSLYRFDGSLILKSDVDRGINDFDANFLSSGVYFIQIQGEGYTYRAKILKP